MTHSCARMIICSPFASQNSFTRSGPNVTRPGPRALGRKPVTLSFSVGSLRGAQPKSATRSQASAALRAAPPEQVHEHHAARLHGQRPYQRFQLLHALDRLADAAWYAHKTSACRGRLAPPHARQRTVHADDALLDDGREGHPVENGVEALPRPQPALLACESSTHEQTPRHVCARAWLPRTQALDALQAEAEQRVDVSRLMVPAQQVHILGVLDLRRSAARRQCANERTGQDVAGRHSP